MKKRVVLILGILLAVYLFSVNVEGAGSQSVNVSVSLVPASPTVSLISPAQGFSTTSTSITLNYNVSHSLNVSNCSLILNNTLVDTDTNISLDITKSFVETLGIGEFIWQVNCIDTSNNQGNSTNRSFSITAAAPPSGGGGGAACTPSCSGNVCGNDGCGGSCGTCGVGESCAVGQCVAPCVDECVLGQQEKECVASDVSRTRVCQIENTCSVWSEWTPSNCGVGEQCQAGVCSACIENWVCNDWGVCSEEEQKRICTDQNTCGTELIKPNETQSCISGIIIDYSPDLLDLIVAPGKEINFEVDIQDPDGVASISVEWYLDDVLQKQSSGVGTLSSFFDHAFNSTIDLEVSVDGNLQTISWTIETNENASLECKPIWICEFTECVEGESYSYPYDCIDLNECGVNTDQPDKQVCDCYPDFECGDWSSCNARYYLDDAIEGSSFVQGYTERICEDQNGCKFDKAERESCDLTTPIVAEVAEFCEEEFVEIFDAGTDELLSRIKKDPILEFTELERLDISLITTSFTGYCSYCFNGIQDNDEEGLDCGGASCPACVEKADFLDWLPFAILFSWIFLLIMLATFAILNKVALANLGSSLLSSAKFGTSQERVLEKNVLRLFKGERKEEVRRMIRKVIPVRPQKVKGAKLAKTTPKELKEQFLKEEFKSRKK